MSAVLQTDVRRHRLTVNDFHRMGEAGILRADERVELRSTERSSTWRRLEATTPERSGSWPKDWNVPWEIRPWCLCRIRYRLRRIASRSPTSCCSSHYYRSSHPGSEDVLLIVEVADTTLAYDRDIKVPLYARHGIPEAWLVDLENKRLHVFTSPSDTGYLESHSLARPAVLCLVALSGSRVDVGGVF